MIQPGKETEKGGVGCSMGCRKEWRVQRREQVKKQELRC